jgi:hypothetical protein
MRDLPLDLSRLGRDLTGGRPIRRRLRLRRQLLHRVATVCDRIQGGPGTTVSDGAVEIVARSKSERLAD